MRQKVDRQRIEKFMHDLATGVDQRVQVYLTGGATAVLLGWRQSTIDIDLKFMPDIDQVFRSIPTLKEQMNINIELASPADFIPEVSGWEDRSKFIIRHGTVTYYHYDFYAQALGKIERFHSRDIQDVKEMLRRGLIEPHRLKELFETIVPRLYRFPAISPEAFRHNLDVILSE